MTRGERALLVLEDGTVFEGFSCGASGEAVGRLTFDTAAIGYLEVLTDPASTGAVTLFTYPQIGNHGVVPAGDAEPRIRSAAVVVREMCFEPSNHRSVSSLPTLLNDQGIVAIEGVDTRALTLRLRRHGSLGAVVSTVEMDVQTLVSRAAEAPPFEGVDLLTGAATSESTAAAEGGGPPVALVDCGAHLAVAARMIEHGWNVLRFSPDSSAEKVATSGARAVVFAGGPGSAGAVPDVVDLCRDLLGRVPIMGIGIGLEILGLAIGAESKAMTRGHHGGNYPVKHIEARRTEITSQNRRFALVPESLGEGTSLPGVAMHDLLGFADEEVVPAYQSDRFGPALVTHVNLNDGAIEGLRLEEQRAWAVGYLPTTSGGPNDSDYLWEWLESAAV